jgi:raffinose/stachyose/melibiose transport system substrate-binding protein
MNRKVFLILSAGMLTTSLSACGADNDTLQTNTVSTDQKIILEVLNPKVEISNQFG